MSSPGRNRRCALGGIGGMPRPAARVLLGSPIQICIQRIKRENMDTLSSQGKPTAAFEAMPDDVLIVEDDAIIAMDFEQAVQSLGVRSVRTAASVKQALELIAERAPYFALLDVGLGSDTSLVVADRLEALAIPFALVTGYSGDLALLSRFEDRPILSKPYVMDDLQAVLRNWSAPCASHGSKRPSD